MEKDVLDALKTTTRQVHCSEPIRRYIAFLAHATRNQPDLALGVSPRGALMLMLAARGHALISGRTYITPDDVLAEISAVFTHRLLLKPEGRLKSRTVDDILSEIVQTVPVPEK